MTLKKRVHKKLPHVFPQFSFRRSSPGKSWPRNGAEGRAHFRREQIPIAFPRVTSRLSVPMSSASALQLTPPTPVRHEGKLASPASSAQPPTQPSPVNRTQTWVQWARVQFGFLLQHSPAAHVISGNSISSYIKHEATWCAGRQEEKAPGKELPPFSCPG